MKKGVLTILLMTCMVLVFSDGVKANHEPQTEPTEKITKQDRLKANTLKALTIEKVGNFFDLPSKLPPGCIFNANGYTYSVIITDSGSIFSFYDDGGLAGRFVDTVAAGEWACAFY